MNAILKILIVLPIITSCASKVDNIQKDTNKQYFEKTISSSLNMAYIGLNGYGESNSSKYTLNELLNSKIIETLKNDNRYKYDERSSWYFRNRMLEQKMLSENIGKEELIGIMAGLAGNGQIPKAKFSITGNYKLNNYQFEINLQMIDNKTGIIVRTANNKIQIKEKNDCINDCIKVSEETMIILLQIPTFPWPPPKSSGTLEVLNSNFRNGFLQNLTLDTIDRKISDSLVAGGYTERGYYSVPGGFAVVTRLERIQHDGTPQNEPNRWAHGFENAGTFTISNYLKYLLSAKVGYYKTLVFVVSPTPFIQSQQVVKEEQIEAWISRGMNTLPAFIGNLPYTEEYNCTVLVYEFKKTDVDEEAKQLIPCRISAKTHLEKSNIWAALEK